MEGRVDVFYIRLLFRENADLLLCHRLLVDDEMLIQTEIRIFLPTHYLPSPYRYM